MAYAICLKEHTDMCKTRLSVDASITWAAPFSLNGNAAIASAGVGAACTTGALSIPSAEALSPAGAPAYANRFCGFNLNTLNAATTNSAIVFRKPFVIQVITTALIAAPTGRVKAGAALIYSQIGCNASG